MGMSIDKAIDIMERYEMYGVGAQKDGRNKAIEIMRKYQKITEIVKSWRENGLDYDSCDAMDNIERVLEDGNDD